MKLIRNLFTFVLAFSLLTSSFYIPSFAMNEKNSWQIEVSSKFGNCERNMLDGNLKTYWHSGYEVVDGNPVNPDAKPFYIYVTMPEAQRFSGIAITPRAASGAQINKVSVYVSDKAGNTADDSLWALVAKDVAFATPAIGDQSPLNIDFGTNVSAKKFMVKIIDTSNPYASIAELDLLQAKDRYPYATSEDIIEYRKIKDDTSVISDKNNWTVSVNSELKGTISKVKDGIISDDNYWHSYYKASGSSITYHDVPPYYIYVTFSEKTVISALDIYPRQDIKNGCPLKLSIYATDEECENKIENMILLEEDIEYEAGFIPRNVDFANNLIAKTLLIEIKGSNGGYGCISEINIDGYDSKKTFSSLEFYLETAHFAKKYEVSKNYFNISCDYNETWNTNSVENMLDGSESTIWQTNSVGTTLTQRVYPTVTVDMNDEYILDEIYYLPRMTEDFHGHWTKFTLETSIDGSTYNRVSEYTFNKGQDLCEIKFDEPVRCRYVRFKNITGYGGYVGGAELYFYQNWDGYNEYNTRYGGTFNLEYGSDEVYCEAGLYAGESFNLDGPVIVKDGWTYIPIVSFIESLLYRGEASEEITSGLRKVTVSQNDGLKTFTLQENNHLVYSVDNNYDDVRYTLYSLPFCQDGIFYAPLHFLCEIIGYEASMDYESGVLTLIKEDFNMYDTVEWVDPAKKFSYYTVNYDLGEEGLGSIAGGKTSDSVRIGDGIYLPSVETGVDSKFEGWYYPGRIKKLAGHEKEAYIPKGDVTLYAVYSTISDIDAVKEEAIANLKNIDLNLYRTAERKRLESIISDAESAILAAETSEDVNTLYSEAKAAIDEIETDEEMTRAEDETGLKLTVTATSGGTVTLDGEPVSGTLVIAAGREIKLEAFPEESGEFKAWIDGTTKKVLGTEKEFILNVYSKRHIIALFSDSSYEDEVFASFISRNNQYVKYLYLNSGTDTKDIAPDEKNMYASGYTFTGWNPALGIITEDTDYRGRYEKIEELYTVTVKNGEEIDNGTEFTAEYNDVYTVVADEAAKGLVFAGWKLNGQIVSYNEMYSFGIFGDIELEATYAKAVVKTPLVVMLDVSKKVQGAYNVASFLATAYIPEGATYLESGILYVKTVADPGTLIMSNLGNKIDDKEIKRTIAVPDMMFKLSASYADLGITARGYLTYLDEQGLKKTIYTDISYIMDEDTEMEDGEIDEDVDFDL